MSLKARAASNHWPQVTQAAPEAQHLACPGPEATAGSGQEHGPPSQADVALWQTSGPTEVLGGPCPPRWDPICPRSCCPA